MMAASMVSADSHRYLLEPLPQERQMLTTGACAVSAASNAVARVEPVSSANNAHRCGVAFGVERSGAKTTQPPSRTQPDLQIAQDIFGDKAVYRLVDDWLAPAIADAVVRDLMKADLNEES
ncbi:MAG: hypothetical protein DMG57_19845 [Acidobacteria bacterium]|nr:MAG: hypothetical protein DMG57_19845 [Acidobacteriota bacterium]